MKRLTLAAGVTICAATLLATAVFAKQEGRGAPIDFEQIDADGDGQITRAEMDGLRAGRFAAVDANGDGNLDLEELEAHGTQRAKERAEKIMERMDANDDGVLSPEEMTRETRATRRFDRMDTDGDGAISKAEFDAVKDRMAKRRHKAD